MTGTASFCRSPARRFSACVFVALFVLMRRVKADMRPVVIMIVLNLVFSFTIPSIDWRAHVGGLVAGAAITFGLVHAPPRHRALVQWGTCALALVVAVVVVAVGAARFTG